jgi:hypothetical protein
MFDNLGRVICPACQGTMRPDKAEIFDNAIRVECRCDGVGCGAVREVSLPRRAVVEYSA